MDIRSSDGRVPARRILSLLRVAIGRTSMVVPVVIMPMIIMVILAVGMIVMAVMMALATAQQPRTRRIAGKSKDREPF